MAQSKTYLNVPYGEKDAAKALGAKWDAAIKKWYAPANSDPTQFAKWQTEASSAAAKKPKSRSSGNILAGVTTHPKDKDFVAYNGDEPPWD